MFLGNYQDMNGSKRVYIMKSADLIVFIDLVRGEFPCDNFAEQAIVSHGLLPV
jgi:hypothetical protein